MFDDKNTHSRFFFTVYRMQKSRNAALIGLFAFFEHGNGSSEIEYY